MYVVEEEVGMGVEREIEDMNVVAAKVQFVEKDGKYLRRLYLENADADIYEL
jgi:hypothetical protein